MSKELTFKMLFHSVHFQGQAFINGFNLGRYWPVEGPQITLYVPAVVLTPTVNTLVLFETEHSPCDASDPFAVCTVEFIDRPIINSTIPPDEVSFGPSRRQDAKTRIVMRESLEIEVKV